MFNKSYFGLKKIAPLLVIFLYALSCKEEVKPLEFETFSVENIYEADIEVTYDKAIPNSDIAKTVNETIISTILKSIPISETNNPKTIEEALNSFDEEFKTFKADFDDSEQKWALAIETEVLYKTENIITMGLSVYADTGGAHGNDSIQFLNINPSSGELYSNEDLFSDPEGFKKLAKIYFLDHMKNEGSEATEFFFGKDFQLPENISFNEEGVILLYNQYEIASFNQGYTEFVIPIDKAQEFLKF